MAKAMTRSQTWKPQLKFSISTVHFAYHYNALPAVKFSQRELKIIMMMMVVVVVVVVAAATSTMDDDDEEEEEDGGDDDGIHVHLYTHTHIGLHTQTELINIRFNIPAGTPSSN